MMWLGNLGPPPLSGPATALWARHLSLGPPPLSGPATAAMAMNGPGIRVAYRVRGELIGFGGELNRLGDGDEHTLGEID